MKTYIIPLEIYGMLTKHFGMQVFHRKDEQGICYIKPTSKRVFNLMKEDFGVEHFIEVEDGSVQ